MRRSNMLGADALKKKFPDMGPIGTRHATVLCVYFKPYNIDRS